MVLNFKCVNYFQISNDDLCVMSQEVKTWLKSGAKSLPLSPECTADVCVSMVEHVLSTKSSYIAGVFLESVNQSSLPDLLLNRGTFVYV